MRIYMPSGFDDEAWRNSPTDWLPELIERKALGETGEVAFLVADILSVDGSTTVDVEINKEGPVNVKVPVGTNFITLAVEGEVWDQADTLDEIVARTRETMANEIDWPLEGTLCFWHHHEKAQPMKLQFAI